MVAEMANLRTYFFAALTSAFWGLVFAIVFKVCDATLSSRMEDNDKEQKKMERGVPFCTLRRYKIWVWRGK